MAHRKWKYIKQQPSMLPGPAVPGYCLVSLHFRWGKLSTRTVHVIHISFLSQEKDKVSGFSSSVLPKKINASGFHPEAGVKKGLTVILDAHTDLIKVKIIVHGSCKMIN